MRVKRSFRAKLILSYVLVVLISVGFIAVFLDKNLENRSLQEIKDSLFIQGNLVISQIEPKELISRNSAYLDNLIQKLSSRMQSRITLITPQGRVLADSQKPLDQALLMENHSLRPEVIQAMRTGRGEEIRYSSTLRIDMLYVALAIKDDADIIGILRLALPLKGVESTLAVIRKTIILSLVFALGFAFLLGSVLAASITRPVNRITGISRDFAKGDFRRRISISSADEIGELAATLNNMAQALEERIKQIQGQGQQLTAIFNSMVEGVIATDSRGRIISLNPPAEKIFSVKKDDILGKTFLEAIRNNDISEIINRTLRQRDAVSEELSLNWPLQRVFQVSASAIFENEKVSGCLLVIHDITEIRKLETVRRDFVANVSHELKTPLTSIKGFVETLLEGGLEDKENSRQFLKIIQEHTERLNSLINDLLDLSCIESKELVLHKQSINLRVLAQRVLSGFDSGAKKKSILLVNQLDEKLNLTVDGDRIEQVFTNLIDNAIKFNRDKGSVKIYSRDEGGKVKIVVEDTGAGIPAKDLPRIFERFYRVDKARSRELGGTGLGLSIVKHIIELHSGSVGVESLEGAGSKFWFVLPK